MIDIQYDLIVYPANISGIVTAAIKAAEGKKVLLINKYGFPGGSITTAFNLPQNLNNLSGAANEIKEQIINRKSSILAENNEQSVLNPESVKTGLLEYLSSLNITLLFHVIPISFDAQSHKLSLTGKEGIITLETAAVIDCSDDYSLIGSVTKKRIIDKASFNLFSSSIDKEEILNYTPVRKYIKLTDKRFWISLDIPVSKEDLFHENYSQDVVNSFESLLLSSGSRINLSAPESFTQYNCSELYINENFYHIAHKLKSAFNINEEFIKAEAVEQIIKNR
jgi:hypothetical protein